MTDHERPIRSHSWPTMARIPPSPPPARETGVSQMAAREPVFEGVTNYGPDRIVADY